MTAVWFPTFNMTFKEKLYIYEMAALFVSQYFSQLLTKIYAF